VLLAVAVRGAGMDRRWRRRLARVAVLPLVAGFAGVAAAHGVEGSRFDAPLPPVMLFVGAGATVALTAALLAATRPGAAGGVGERLLFTVSPTALRVARVAGSAGFLAAFALALLAGLFGPRTPAANFGASFVWAVWLVGVGLLAAAVGSAWRTLSPWQTLYRGLCRLEGDTVAVAGEYPAWLGRWPALAGVLGVGLLEHLTVVPRSPPATTVVVAGYAAVMLLGAVAFGPAFLHRADALAVLYRLFGRVAPLRFRADDRTVSVRAPWTGCVPPLADRGAAAVAVAAVYVVSFVGATSTPEYQALVLALRETALGAFGAVALYAAGFALFWAAFVAVARLTETLGTGAASTTTGGRPTGPLRALAPTLLPIAVGYEVAHYYPYVVRNLARSAALLGRPLAADPGVGAVTVLGWLPLSAFWASQVVLVVGGHVTAVVAAHAVAADRYPSRRAATLAHLPLTALMVGYTALSLWLVSRPVVA
jgi:hypothetical protein